MLDDLVPVIGILCAIALPICISGITLINGIKSRHEERMEMIRQGIILKEPEKPKNRYPALRKGIVMTFLGLGLLIGIGVAPYLSSGAKGGIYELIILSFTILFGGMGFILYAIITNKQKEKEEETDNNI